MTVQAAEASQKNGSRFDILACQPPAGLLERVAREQGWSSERTQLAWGEYLKFCVLAVARQGRASPSHAVDAVWHAHLLFTQDYWGPFCREVLQFDLHHVPATGGGDAKAFARQYGATLTTYESTFGISPPPEFWPPPGTRHGHERVVDEARYWLLPKPSQAMRTGLAQTAVAGACLLLLGAVIAIALGAGPASPAAPVAMTLNLFNWDGPSFLGFFGVGYIALFISALVVRRLARNAPGHADATKPMDAYGLAMLSGKERLTTSAAVASLAARGSVTPSDGRVALADGVEANAFKGNDLERQIVQRLSLGSHDIASLATFAAPTLQQIRLRLTERGLLVDPATSNWARTVCTLLALTIPALGLIKIVVGISRGKPVMFLMILVLFGTIIAMTTFLRSLHRTNAGDEVLARMRRENDRASLSAATSATQENDAAGAPQRAPLVGGFDPLVLGLALYGTTMLVGTPYEDFRQVMSPPGSSDGSDSSSWSSDSSSSSDSGSSSDGGSSCGGSGCGGCGGGGD